MEVFDLFKRYLRLIHSVSVETIEEFEREMIEDFPSTNAG